MKSSVDLQFAGTVSHGYKSIVNSICASMDVDICKSVAINFFGSNHDVQQLVAKEKLKKKSINQRTTYLVIPTANNLGSSITCGTSSFTNILNDSVKDVKMNFSSENVINNDDHTQPEFDYSIEPISTFADDFLCEQIDLHTIECFDTDQHLQRLNLYNGKLCKNNSGVNVQNNFEESDNFKRNNQNSVNTLCNGRLRSSFCLVCGAGVSSDDYVLISSENMSCTGRSLAKLLGNTVGDSLSILMSSNEILCGTCFKMLETLDVLEHKLQHFTRILLAQYWTTADKRCQHSSNSMNIHKSYSQSDEEDVYPKVNSSKLNAVKKSSTDCFDKIKGKTVYGAAAKFTKRKKERMLSHIKSNLKKSKKPSLNIWNIYTAVKGATDKKVEDTEGNDAKCSITVQSASEGEFDATVEECIQNTASIKTSKRGCRMTQQDKWCRYCNKWIRSKYYSIHLNTHTHHVSYPCRSCSLVFYTVTSLQSHCRRNHTDSANKKHQCFLCKKNFVYPAELARHVNTVHKNVRKYTCQVCQMSFKMIAHLNYHMRSHTGEKPNCCHVCQRCFRRPGELKNHVTKVHCMQYLGKYRERLKKVNAGIQIFEECQNNVTVTTDDPNLYSNKCDN